MRLLRLERTPPVVGATPDTPAALRRAYAAAALRGVLAALVVGAAVAAFIAVTDRTETHLTPIVCEVDDRAEGTCPTEGPR